MTTASARTILGVPFMPPPIVSEATTRLRARVGRLHRLIAPPPVQILEAALSLLDHRVLVTLCAAGVPDALTSTMSVDALAALVPIDRTRLERYVRFAATRGWLRTRWLRRLSVGQRAPRLERRGCHANPWQRRGRAGRSGAGFRHRQQLPRCAPRGVVHPRRRVDGGADERWTGAQRGGVLGTRRQGRSSTRPHVAVGFGGSRS